MPLVVNAGNSASAADILLAANAGALQSTDDLSLAVNGGTGSDAPTSTRPSRLVGGDYTSEPFATIQAAIDALPRLLRKDDNVTIAVAPGSYAGFDMRSYVGNVSIFGSMQTAVLATGPSSGTVTSATTKTLTVTGAGWTASNLVGKLVRITAGTGAGFGNNNMIVGNTTDTITVANGFSPVPDGTSSFVIEEPAVLINTGTSLSAAVNVDEFTGTFQLSAIKIEVPAFSFKTGISVQRATRLLLNNVVVQYAELYGWDLQSLRELEVLFCAIVQASSGSQIDNVEKISQSSGIGQLVLKDDMRISNVDEGHLRYWATTNTLQLSKARYLEFQGFVSDGADTAVAASDCLRIQANLMTVDNATVEPFDLDNVFLRGFFAGSGNAGYGVRADAPTVVVELTSVPTITGSSGDATVDGTSALTWSTDFAAVGDGVLSSTGSRIIRT